MSKQPFAGPVSRGRGKTFCGMQVKQEQWTLACKPLPLRKVWCLDLVQIRQKASRSDSVHAPTEASEIPYGSDFGVDPSVEQPVTLQEFLSAPSVKRRRSTTGLGIHELQQKKRMYFFVAVDDEAQPQLSKLFSKALHLVVGGPLTFPCFDVSSGPSGSPFRITTLQFAVGEEGSGSPMHFHQDAVNLLLSGKKRWWLQPPSLAAMSRLHPLDVQRCDGEALQCYDTACVLEQEVGDVMYVPDMWGHAILNLEPHTVCAAAEFA